MRDVHAVARPDSRSPERLFEEKLTPQTQNGVELVSGGVGDTERRVFDVPKDRKDQVRIFITMAKKAAE